MCFTPPVSPTAILFDFDGTLSTLRHGWEKVMRPLMLEMIDPQNPNNPALQQEVDEYIDQSTGIQTVYQMEWLAQKVAQHGKNPQVQDKWWYKEEYNRRLMKQVEQRIAQLETGTVSPEAFLIEGSIPLLERLKSTGVSLYVASGTDHDDVVREAKALGVADYFAQILRSAPTAGQLFKGSGYPSAFRRKGIQRKRTSGYWGRKSGDRIGKGSWRSYAGNRLG